MEVVMVAEKQAAGTAADTSQSTKKVLVVTSLLRISFARSKCPPKTGSPRPVFSRSTGTREQNIPSTKKLVDIHRKTRLKLAMASLWSATADLKELSKTSTQSRRIRLE